MPKHAFLKGSSTAAVTLIGAKIEKHLVEKHLEQLRRSKRYRVDCKDEYITIYESDADIGELKDLLGDFLKHTSLRSGINADEAMNALVGAANQNYTAMLRFHLIDKERRIFMAQRFCFRTFKG